MTINVFIVDDSATARTALRLILDNSDEINVIGVASNPLIALKRMVKTWPDVIISDLEMPEMHGTEFLEYIQRNRPTPFIVFSNYTGSSALSSVEALSQGAADIIAKPNFSNTEDLNETSEHVLNAIKAASRVLPQQIEKPARATARSDDNKRKKPALEPEMTQEELLDLPELSRSTFELIAIGSSTGGTTVIEKFLRRLKPDSPGVVIVQHMPEHFTNAFANRVNQFCSIDVREAVDGDEVKPGVALIAPGGKHMRVSSIRGRCIVSVFEGDSVNRHRPSVDVLFNSVAEFFGNKALAIILTGMGKDGAKGMLALQQKGAETIAQSEEDCAVYGMPKAAVALGAANHQFHSAIIAELLARLKPVEHS
jgi:two-component system chemotaxis response regulator CheB